MTEAAKKSRAGVAAAEKDGEPFASRVRRERLSVDHMLLLSVMLYDGLTLFQGKEE